MAAAAASPALTDQKKSCPACQKSPNTDGLLHCCAMRICGACMMNIVFKLRPSVCPFCKANPYDAVMASAAAERKANPNEVRITSVMWQTLLSDFTMPIDGSTTVQQIMNGIGERVGFDLSHKVEGGCSYKRFLSSIDSCLNCGGVHCRLVSSGHACLDKAFFAEINPLRVRSERAKCAKSL